MSFMRRLGEECSCNILACLTVPGMRCCLARVLGTSASMGCNIISCSTTLHREAT